MSEVKAGAKLIRAVNFVLCFPLTLPPRPAVSLSGWVGMRRNRKAASRGKLSLDATPHKDRVVVQNFKNIQFLHKYP